METWVMGAGLRPVGKPSDRPPDPNAVARHRSIPTTGLESRMKESYGEVLARHAGPESYAGHGNVAGVATTGVHAGPVSSSVISFIPCADTVQAVEGNIASCVTGQRGASTAESQTWSMRGNSKRENREIPRVSRVRWHVGTAGKRHRRYSRHVRWWEVRWSHSTCEADEQNRNPGGGARGGKGITRGKGCMTPCWYRTQYRAMPGIATCGYGW
jgi:hypothetical protein